MELKYKKLHEKAIAPSYATEGSAGFDLHSIQSNIINPGAFVMVQTGLSLEIPEGYELQIRPRSGLAAKYGITVLNSPGTIDSDYRGEIKVLLINLGTSKYILQPYDRIAQGVLAKLPDQAHFVESDSLSETKRGTGGFGSTGK